MEQMQGPSMPHIVQVYQTSEAKLQNSQLIHISHPPLSEAQAKVTYQQEVQPASLPVSENIVITCETQFHNTTSTMQSQVLQTDVSQALQFASHMILPHPMFKQHVLMDTTQYYGQYSTFAKEPPIAKFEAAQEICMNNPTEHEPNNIEAINQNNIEISSTKKRSRSLIRNPTKWACNVRKVKHQNGEAYVSRRGKYVPEKHVRNTKNCKTNCRLKCNNKISDADRELIFKAFYSLTANEKKHFLLNTTERHSTKRMKMDTNTKRQYSFKYFFLIRGVRHTVCKNFYLGTLAISQKPIYNVHLSKTDLNIPKPDGRGLSATSIHGLPSAVKDQVRSHILSFRTADNLPIKQFSRKKQYMEPNLTIKQMYMMYVNDCNGKNLSVVRESMYRKILRQDFNLYLFKKNKSDQLCAKCKEPIKKKTQCSEKKS